MSGDVEFGPDGMWRPKKAKKPRHQGSRSAEGTKAMGASNNSIAEARRALQLRVAASKANPKNKSKAGTGKSMSSAQIDQRKKAGKASGEARRKKAGLPPSGAPARDAAVDNFLTKMRGKPQQIAAVKNIARVMSEKPR